MREVLFAPTVTLSVREEVCIEDTLVGQPILAAAGFSGRLAADYGNSASSRLEKAAAARIGCPTILLAERQMPGEEDICPPHRFLRRLMIRRVRLLRLPRIVKIVFRPLEHNRLQPIPL